jgi:hypothetical protein
MILGEGSHGAIRLEDLKGMSVQMYQWTINEVNRLHPQKKEDSDG